MANPFSGIITADFLNLHTNMISALIDGCKVNCRIIYGDSSWTMCDNCKFSPISSRSSGLYLNGGPLPFSTGVCPKCKGVGRIAVEHTVDIPLLAIWDYKSWIMSVPVQTPEAYVQTVGIFTYFDEIKRAKEIIVDTAILDYTRNVFVRYGEPKPCGLGGSNFVVTTWRRIE